MKTVMVLLVLLSNQGHWFGGQASTVSVRWATVAAHPDAVLTWDLMLGPARLVGGKLAMPADGQPTRVMITPPEVRARTSMQWVYRLYDRDGGKELARGEELIHVYPAQVLKGVGKLVIGKRIFVWDQPPGTEDALITSLIGGQSAGLARVLDAAGVRCTAIQRPSDLPLTTADIILVGPDRIEAGAFVQSPLLNQAEAGANVLMFAQSHPRILAGYNLLRRAAPKRLDWRETHPLLEGFQPEDLQSWLTGQSNDVWAVQLPADEPALEIGYWPRETPGREPVPIDALLLTKAVGKGRIVLCQIPLGPWGSDPRSQLLLRNALGYLATRPEPTPPPSRRRERPERVPTTVPTITIPPGDRP